jgi:hypothetical protein
MLHILNEINSGIPEFFDGTQHDCCVLYVILGLLAPHFYCCSDSDSDNRNCNQHTVYVSHYMCICNKLTQKWAFMMPFTNPELQFSCAKGKCITHLSFVLYVSMIQRCFNCPLNSAMNSVMTGSTGMWWMSCFCQFCLCHIAGRD